LRFSRCVSANPAAVFAPLLVLPLRSVFDAADAALPDVTLGGVILCDRAEPAAVFEALLVKLLLSTLDAAVAARLLVTSLFLAISTHLKLLSHPSSNLDGRRVIKHKVRQ
jgi:hypothetical protein